MIRHFSSSSACISLALVLFVFPWFGPACESPDANLDFYGPTPPVQYLLGDFAPEKHPAFVRLDRMKIPTGGRTIYLRAEAAEALKRMFADFQKAHPGVEFWVTSGTRNFRDQRGIWEAKWNGERLVDGKQLNKTIADSDERARKILEYSSMPGTSRHHWGTDFDINKLTNGYYKSGPGAVLYGWLVKNGARYGFCQPYTAGREAGYFEERWHWTYLPLSRKYLADWKQIVAERYPAGKSFAGSTGAAELATIYVETINPACR